MSVDTGVDSHLKEKGGMRIKILLSVMLMVGQGSIQLEKSILDTIVSNNKIILQRTMNRVKAKN